MFHSYLKYFLDHSRESINRLNLDSLDLETPIRLQQYLHSWLKALDSSNFQLLKSRLSLTGVGDLNRLENFFYSLPLAWELSASYDQKRSLDWLLESIQTLPIDSYNSFIGGFPSEISELPFADLWIGVYLNAWDLIVQDPSFQDFHFVLGVEFDPANTVINLITSLSRIFEATLYCEFKKYRSTCTSINLSSIPDESSLFYAQFVDHLKTGGFKNLLQKYPCLLFRASNIVLCWNQSVILFLQRFANHRSKILNFFGLSQSFFLRSFSPGLGDQHNYGQSATLIRLSDSDQKIDYHLIYKPLSIDMFQAYNSFLDQLNHFGCPYPFKCVRSIGFMGFGYIEYIPHVACESTAEYDQYCLRLGALTAVLFLLRANDCHHENIISNHIHPVLIDCETIMQPYFRGSNEEADHDFLREGIQRTGLVGSWIWDAYSSTSIDIGAIGFRKKSLERISIWTWQYLNTDRMKLVREMNPVVSASCHPSTINESEEQDIRKHQLVIQGFSDLGSFFVDLEDHASLSALVKQIFSGLSSRVLIRDTGDYGQMLHRSNAPSYASSFFRSGMLFEKLLKLFVHHEHFQLSYRIYCSEVEQLELNDIPIFFMQTDLTRLSDASGECLMEDYAQLSAVDAVLQSITKLHIEFSDQAKMLDKYLSISLLHDVILSPKKTLLAYAESTEPTECSYSLCHDLAFNCGDLLLDECLELSFGLLWSKLEIDEGGSNLSLEPLSSSLYDGCLGIIIYLDELASNTNYLAISSERERKVQLVIERFLDPLLILFLESSDDALYQWINQASLGLNGIGGCLLALHILSSSTYLGPSRVQQILQAIKIIIARLSGYAFQPISFDLMTGIAGLLSGLLCTNDHSAIALASDLGCQLLAIQKNDGAWSKRGDRVAQASFAHGSCGIASALSRLYQVTHESTFQASALKGFAYQNQFFDLSVGNWQDLRTFSAEISRLSLSTNGHQPTIFSSSWCAGSAGVLMSRLIAWNTGLYWDSLAADIQAGYRSTFLRGSHERFHLCCGLSGRLSVIALLTTSTVCGLISKDDQVSTEKFKLEAVEQLTHVLHSRRSAIAATGLSNVRDIAPGLFDGLAGIGMACLANSCSNSASKLSQLISAGLYVQSNL